MIWSICESLDLDYSKYVIHYQSRYFEDRFPEENRRVDNVVLVDVVPNDLEASLLSIMCKAMLERPNLAAAIFIGGMECVEIEYDLFHRFHPNKKRLLIVAPGRAELDLAKRDVTHDRTKTFSVDFASLFYSELVLQMT